MILERKLAPFFLGLNDFEPDWPLASLLSALADADEQALANLKEALQAAINSAAEVEVVQLSNPSTTRKGKDAAHAAATAVLHRERLVELIKLREKRSATLQRNQREQEAKLYVRDAVECPICFLFVPHFFVLLLPNLGPSSGITQAFDYITLADSHQTTDITLHHSFTHDVVINPFAPNVSFRSNEQIQPQPISNRSLPPVPSAWNRTLVPSTSELHLLKLPRNPSCLLPRALIQSLRDQRLPTTLAIRASL